MRLRLIAPVLVVIAVIAGAFAVTLIDSVRDGVLVLAGGLALAAVTGALAVTTERRRRALREVERFFTLSPEMVILAGFDGYWKRVNPAVEAVLGYTEREALAQPFMEFVHPDDRERTEQEAGRVVGGATALAFENRIVCKNGSYKWIEWTVMPVPEERVMYGVGRDVTERRRSESEQAALRRVATLVARDAPSTEVFEAVATEVAKLLDTDITVLGRYDDDGAATAIGSWSASPVGVPVGTRSVLGGHNVLTLVAETGKPARVEGYDDATGEAADIARRFGWSSSIAAPVIVEGRLWGVMLVATQRVEPFPAGAEERLAAFTDLVATAVANAQAHDEVRRFGDEQRALGRVATLVAGGAAPEHVFTAVVDEVSSLLGLERIELVRYDGDATGTVIAASGDHPFPAGSTWSLDDPSVMAVVARAGHAARIDDYSNLEGEIARTARSAGFRSAIGAPMTVEGRLWGVIIAISTDPEPIPERSEARLGQFTDLVATAVANAEARHALEHVASEQATLRRIATLVAQGLQPEEIFAVVIEEVGRLFGTDLTTVGRFDDDQPALVAVALGKGMQGVEVGTRWALEDPLTAVRVFQSGRSVRVDERLRERSAALADMLARLGVVSTVSSPIMVEGRLWGAVLVSRKDELPVDTEERLEKFTELVATAVANAESRSELAASRRRIVAASDETRRQIERDLHDGTQQRLVSLGLAVRAAEADLPPERDDLRAQLSGVAAGLVAAVEDLQEISRGIHPAILSKGGLAPALRSLAHRSAIPVDLDITADVRLEEQIEVAAYFVASEALANAAKHSEASRIDVSLDQRDGCLFLSVRDDGVGGADAARGSGLVGLTDRVEALGGSIRVSSRPGEGTQIAVELPAELKPSPTAGSQPAPEGPAGPVVRDIIAEP